MTVAPSLRPLAAVAILCAAGAFAGCRNIRPPADVACRDVAMLTTGYCKCGACCGWKRTWYGMPVLANGPNAGSRKRVGITASGARARPGTIAADPSIYPFGTVMFVPGYGYGRVEDVGGAIQGQHIDLFFRTHSQARKWGTQNLRVRVWPAAAPAKRAAQRKQP